MLDLIKQMWNEEIPVDMKIVNQAMHLLDSGELTCVIQVENKWKVNELVKKAILLYLRNNLATVIENGYDKVPLKTANWTDKDFKSAGFRVVPGSIIRYGAFIAPGVVVMPSFINMGAYIDEQTMIDTHATVGSCARIGKKCHISDGVTIGGVLEPLQETPVIVEDQCFIGAGARITEGIIVKHGSVIASGTVLTKSTPIIDRESGNVVYGVIPSFSVVVPGVRNFDNGLGISCAVIIKRVDEKTRSKTSINELLR